MEKYIRKATSKSTILKNMFNNRDSNFLIIFSPARPKEILREENWWLTGVGHNTRWHVKLAQHAVHNPNFEKMGYSDISKWWHKKINGPDHMVEGDHHLRNKAQYPSTLGVRVVCLISMAHNIMNMDCNFITNALLCSIMRCILPW